MAEERNPGEPDEQVEDLDVAEEESEDVKGGLNFSKVEVSGFKEDIRGIKAPGDLGGLKFNK